MTGLVLLHLYTVVKTLSLVINNQQATENDDSCIYCDTPEGEELCNEYHGDSTYWEFYSNLFDCDDEVIYTPDAGGYVSFVNAVCDDGIVF